MERCGGVVYIFVVWGGILRNAGVAFDGPSGWLDRQGRRDLGLRSRGACRASELYLANTGLYNTKIRTIHTI